MNLYMACNEGVEFSRVLHALEYPYRLSSYYGLQGDSKDRAEIFAMSLDGSQHIMDSGLFSLMFGADKGKLTKYEDFYAYASKYVESMIKWGWQHAIVECDTQIVLGMDETFRLREEIFEKCGLDVIYVWHAPEQLDGLREMAKKYTRIALSVPELRKYAVNTKSSLISLLRVIRETGASPRVHLLGNTEAKYMTLPAESGDSSSWIYCQSFGIGRLYNGKSVATPSIRSPRWRAWELACAKMYPAQFAKVAALQNPARAVCLAACAASYWNLMDRSVVL